jgi:hypothetical protein
MNDIISSFGLDASRFRILPHGGGHINENYHVASLSAGETGYLLQKINHFVFRDVPLLMENIATVTTHLARNNPEGAGKTCLRLLKTPEGKQYVTGPGDSYWRMFYFIGDHLTFEAATDPSLAYEGAGMFGRFLRNLETLPAGSLGETIPNFHNLKARLRQLRDSISGASSERMERVGEELKYIWSKAPEMGIIQDLADRSILPKRVTHNDTKINNVLFDRNRKGLCVVDLDTVMPGLVHYDFGDGIRTFANTGKEDDTDLDRVTMDPELFRAFAEGYLKEAGPVLSQAELETLHLAGILFPFMQGVRFLTDYLNGDIYYRTGYEDHNLVRARAQLRLAKEGDARRDLWKTIIFKACH